MATVNVEIDVAAPVSKAYDQWTQFEEFPRFMSGIVDVRQIDDVTTHWVAEVDGQRREWNAEIVEQQPDRLIAWNSIDEGGSSGRVTFEPSSTGAKVNVQLEWDPEGLKESAGAMVGLDERQVRDDLERFRTLVESRDEPTGSWTGTIEGGEVVEDDRGGLGR